MGPEIKRWTDDEDAILRREALAGSTVAEIASAVGRAESAVRVRAYVLRVLLRPVGPRFVGSKGAQWRDKQSRSIERGKLPAAAHRHGPASIGQKVLEFTRSADVKINPRISLRRHAGGLSIAVPDIALTSGSSPSRLAIIFCSMARF
jgi:hypothetical protein